MKAAECCRCPWAVTSENAYAGHLVEVHLYSPDRAQAIARGAYLGCCDRVGPDHGPGCSWRKRALFAMPSNQRAKPEVAPRPEPPPTPTPEEETPMPDLSVPVPCHGCKKPFVRAHPRAGYCEACQKKLCTSCNTRGGNHRADCPRRKSGGQPVRSSPTKALAAQRARKAAATKRAKRPDVVTENGAGIAARIQGLVQLVEAGRKAESALAEIRKLVRA